MGEMSTLLLASQGTQAATSAASAYGQTQALSGQQQYANRMTSMNVESLRAQGHTAQSRSIQEGEMLAARQATSYAGRGVDVTSGSAAAIQAEARAMGEIRGLQYEAEAMDRALGMKHQNRMGQIATRGAINNSIAEAGMNVGNSAMRAAYMHERYKGLDGTGLSPEEQQERDRIANTPYPEL